MSESANHMRYMLFFGKQTSRIGCGCCSLKQSTLLISFIGIIISIPIIIGILLMTWKDFEEIPIIFTVFKSFGVLAPLLMFIGAMKMDFTISYVGYVMHSLYIYGLIFFSIFIGLFWGIVILPVVVISPPYLLFYLIYFLFWAIYIGLLLNFNHIYNSFTRNLGRGQHALCSHLVYDDPFVSYHQHSPNDVRVNI
jgi:hypothetical protein